MRYNGQYYDEETGMYYLRARYYDPQIRRFISEDPIKDGVNWYAYCGNNPVNFTDPSGLFGKNTILRNGIRNNPDVVKVQKRLNDLGFTDANGKELIIDGDFGANTEYAVRQYQKNNDLSVDGLIGKNTWSSLGFEFDTYAEKSYAEYGGQKNIKAKAIYAEINEPSIISNSPNIVSGEAAFSKQTVYSNRESISFDMTALVIDGELGVSSGLNMALLKGTINFNIPVPILNKNIEGNISGYAFGLGKDISGGFGSSVNAQLR